MLGLMYIALFTIAAVALYFALPRTYRWMFVFLSGSIWYIGSCLSGDYNYSGNEYVSGIYAGTYSHLTSYETSTFVNLKNIKKSFDDFGTNNRQRFKRIANCKSFLTLFLRHYKPEAPIQLASECSSSHSFITKDQYFGILTRLTE